MIFLPKIIEIGQCTLKAQATAKNVGDPFLRHNEDSREEQCWYMNA